MASDLCHILEVESDDVCFWDWDEKPWKTMILNPKNMEVDGRFSNSTACFFLVPAVNFQGVDVRVVWVRKHSLLMDGAGLSYVYYLLCWSKKINLFHAFHHYRSNQVRLQLQNACI